MNYLGEDLLDAWLTLSSIISNERLVSYMPFNEAYVCNLLYKQMIKNPTICLTATDLCTQTRMLKSQMNKTLKSLEEKGLIQKTRSTQDKRIIYISLCQDQLHIYEQEHTQTLQLIGKLIEKTGIENTHKTITLLNDLAKNFSELIQERNFYGN